MINNLNDSKYLLRDGNLLLRASEQKELLNSIYEVEDKKKTRQTLMCSNGLHLAERIRRQLNTQK